MAKSVPSWSQKGFKPMYGNRGATEREKEKRKKARANSWDEEMEEEPVRLEKKSPSLPYGRKYWA